IVVGVIREVLSPVGPEIERQSIRLETCIAPNVPRVMGDQRARVELAELRRRYDTLIPHEQVVMAGVVASLLNKNALRHPTKVGWTRPTPSARLTPWATLIRGPFPSWTTTNRCGGL